MSRRIIPCQVTDEYVRGSGVVVGAAGSHNDVALRLAFSPMWAGTARSIVWKDALGGNPTVTILGTNLLETGETEVYIVPIPAEPKAYAGDLSMTIKGAVVDGDKESSATLTARAFFTVMESDWDEDAAESGDISPTQAEQFQAQLEAIKDDIANSAQAAADANASAQAAAASETAAGNHANSASNSAALAALSAQGAANSATQAADSNRAAKASEQAAATSAAAAKASETNAATSASTATTKASEAANSASTASTNASDAAASAAAAHTARNGVESAQVAAAASAAAAKASETNAQSSADTAAYWAGKAQGAAKGDMMQSVYDPDGKQTNIFAYVEEHGGAQSDWNENDPESKAYVKNRFGGYYEESRVEQLAETSITVDRDGGGIDFNVWYPFDWGATFGVVFDGIEYICTHPEGQLSLGTSDFSETPFFIYYLAPEDEMDISCETAGTHTIAIYVIEEAPVPIDEKFLPDTVATKEYVDAAVSAIPTPNVSGQISTHNTDTAAHSDIRTLAANAQNAAAAAQAAAASKAPMYTYGTADLTAGSSSLATGTLHFVYE